jgi:hypothetical protein
MAEADWNELDDSLSVGSVARGVTAGLGVPNGGGSFVYAFNSLDANTGAVGLFPNQVSYAPMAKGCTVIAAMKRGLSGGTAGWSIGIAGAVQGNSVEDNGYVLGLSEGAPSHVVLYKGALVNGIPDLAPAPATNGVLRRSTASVPIDEYVHLRLDVIVNLNGDVRLQVFQNDLSLHALGTAPTWVAIPGMAEFVDDALSVNSGSAPYTSGRAAMIYRKSDVTRRACVDHFSILRQL